MKKQERRSINAQRDLVVVKKGYDSIQSIVKKDSEYLIELQKNVLKASQSGKQKDVIDNVMFIMPRNKEYQFPAVAVVQAYVLGFAKKMSENDASYGQANWVLKYDISNIDKEDWDFFRRAGMGLPETTPLQTVDCVVDMSDDRIESYFGFGKHVAQACGIMGGVSLPPLPKLNRISPKIDEFRWLTTSEEFNAHAEVVSEDAILALGNLEATGIVDNASRITYYALARGLACIEVVPRGRPRDWLSKWASAGYRLAERETFISLANQISRGISSIEKEIITHVRKQLTSSKISK